MFFASPLNIQGLSCTQIRVYQDPHAEKFCPFLYRFKNKINNSKSEEIDIANKPRKYNAIDSHACLLVSKVTCSLIYLIVP